MRDNEDKNFWKEFLKWFVIGEFAWIIIEFIVYVFKELWLLLYELIKELWKDIKNISPSMNVRLNKLYIKCKAKIRMIFLRCTQFIKAVKNKKWMQVEGLDKKTRMKKLKYSFLEFYYNYELIILGCIFIIVIIFVIIL